jgi:hypothetical protein
MKTHPLTPTKLRLVLSVTLILIVAISGTAFYFAYQKLEKMAVDAGSKVADASKSQNTLQELKKLKQNLEANQDMVNKAALVAADGQNYTYQDQIVRDLTTYAARSGMVISNITFSPGETASAAPAAPAAPAAGTPTAPPIAAAPTGLKKTTVTVTVKNPADYRGLLNFLHYIEQNLTKLKIANVTLTKGDTGTVNTNALSLEVYLR